ncbi:MAG: M15 family metallopeptidase [Gemmatimonadota bacterium]
MRSLVLVLLLATSADAQSSARSDSPFVSIADIAPTIVVDARYHGSHNFIGRPIAGYEAPKCLVTLQAGAALARVQAELRPFGLGLQTFDCYRPQRAVDDFVAWAADPADTTMKEGFYPAVDKADLFDEGYIAERSGHSRGSTVDLTIVPLPAQPPEREVEGVVDCRLPAPERLDGDSLDMGTAYDCFDPLSHTANPAIAAEARRNRLLLKAVMEKHGFTNYTQEWWHFTLSGEPYPDRYFDVPVR